ncbi:MAG: PAS domain S-box protein [Spirochaetales bacterium]|nr:PAS domain S-box protein [Spirochaetales bacterium]
MSEFKKQKRFILDSASHELLLEIIKTSPVSIIILDKSGRIIFANTRAEKVLELKKNDITQRTYNDPLWKITDFKGRPFPNKDLPFVVVKRTGKSVFNIRHAIEKPDGKKIFLSINASPIFDEKKEFNAMVASLEDVTEKVLSKKALKESEARYRQLFNRIHSGVAIYEAVNDGEDFIFKDFNRAAETIDSIKKQELMGKRVSRVFHGVKKFGLLNAFRSVYKTGKPRHHPVSFYKDERITGWRENYIYKLPSGEVISVYEDRTKQKQDEMALRESEAMLKSIFRAAPIGIGLVKNRVFCWTNNMIHKITGYSEKELLGKNARIIYPSQAEYEFVGEEKYNQIKEKGIGTVETLFKRKDGKIIDVILSSTPLDLNNFSKGVIFTALDITKRKQMENQLRHAEKMLAIGQLAGGIAHDFNNQLLGIICYVDLLREAAETNPLMHEYIDHIYNITERAADLVDQLLAFSRKEKYLSVPVDVHKILREVFSLLEHTITKRIIIKMELNAKQSVLIGDPSQLQNVFLNLALNARDAMPDGGELTFSTDLIRLDKQVCSKYGVELASGTYLKIEVADTGVGMSAEVQRQIFEPFFTTKEQGKGIGMGLAAVQGTVKKHKGEITVSSRQGRGAVFTLFLPLPKKISP